MDINKLTCSLQRAWSHWIWNHCRKLCC